MSRFPDLPPELAQLERQLRDLPLEPAAINREETLYRAGYAAAEAALRGGGGRGWFWPATSGVLAASVLVLSVLLVRGTATPQVAEGNAPQHTEIDETQQFAAAESNPWTLPTLPWLGTPEINSPLAVRWRIMHGQIPDWSHSADQGGPTTKQPQTRAELLDELLGERTNS
jgi:hypothetical protein